MKYDHANYHWDNDFPKDVAEDKAYHIMRAIRHGTTYWNLRHGTETDPNGETDEEHLMKMITRAAMELAILRAEKAQKGA